MLVFTHVINLGTVADHDIMIAMLPEFGDNLPIYLFNAFSTEVNDITDKYFYSRWRTTSKFTYHSRIGQYSFEVVDGKLTHHFYSSDPYDTLGFTIEKMSRGDQVPYRGAGNLFKHYKTPPSEEKIATEPLIWYGVLGIAGGGADSHWPYVVIAPDGLGPDKAILAYYPAKEVPKSIARFSAEQNWTKGSPEVGGTFVLNDSNVHWIHQCVWVIDSSKLTVSLTQVGGSGYHQVPPLDLVTHGPTRSLPDSSVIPEPEPSAPEAKPDATTTNPQDEPDISTTLVALDTERLIMPGGLYMASLVDGNRLGEMMPHWQTLPAWGKGTPYQIHAIYNLKTKLYHVAPESGTYPPGGGKGKYLDIDTDGTDLVLSHRPTGSVYGSPTEDPVRWPAVCPPIGFVAPTRWTRNNGY